MTSLLEIREYLRAYYGRYEMYINPILHFLVSFISLTILNQRLGYFTRINGFMPVFVVSLICSILPYGALSFFGALFILLHLYSLSLEVTALVLGILLIMYLLYFRFNTGDSIALLLTPLLFFFKIPYVMPLAVGLLTGPAAAVSVGCGTVVYYILNFINKNSTVLLGNEQTAAGERFKFCLDGILKNKEMMLMVVVFFMTILVVYIIRRLSVDYSWMIAVIAGAIGQVVIILMGDLILDVGISLGGTIFGSLVAVVIAFVIQFFQFMLDYTRTERVQFEDDDYYYYVKAVPKINLGTTERTTKKINQRRHTYDEEDAGGRHSAERRSSGGSGSSSGHNDSEEDVRPYVPRTSERQPERKPEKDHRTPAQQVSAGRPASAQVSSNPNAAEIARHREELLRAREQAVRRQSVQSGQRPAGAGSAYIDPAGSGSGRPQAQNAASYSSVQNQGRPARSYSQSVRKSPGSSGNLGGSDADRDAARREAVQRLRQLQSKSGNDGE